MGGGGGGGGGRGGGGGGGGGDARGGGGGGGGGAGGGFVWGGGGGGVGYGFLFGWVSLSSSSPSSMLLGFTVELFTPRLHYSSPPNFFPALHTKTTTLLSLTSKHVSLAS